MNLKALFYEFLKTISTLKQSTRAVLEKEIKSILSFQEAISSIEIKLNQYPDRLEKELQRNEFIDQSLANELHLKSLALIEICREDPLLDHVPMSLAAINYFLNEDDADKDFKNLSGFEDDKQVLELVIEKFSLFEKVNKKIEEIKKQKS